MTMAVIKLRAANNEIVLVFHQQNLIQEHLLCLNLNDYVATRYNFQFLNEEILCLDV